MSLTGSFFLDGIIVLTLVAFVGVVCVWPRLTPAPPGTSPGESSRWPWSTCSCC